MSRDLQSKLINLNMSATALYPEQSPYDTGHFDVGDGHQLHYARYGNPSGDPVVYLHGGPGGNYSFEYRFFNPEHFNVLLFDQRGAGKSLPYAGVAQNNMAALVGDIEKLRRHFGVERWHVAGGSFGSTLGMFYALHHPERVRNLLLRGIFFGDSAGARYIIDDDGAGAVNRNKWFEDYINHIPPAERASGLTMPYYNRLHSADRARAVEAARLFHLWDASIATQYPSQALLDKINSNPEASLSLSKLFFHYAVHHFTPENKKFLLDGMAKLPHSIDIIHGRQDHITPVPNAILLHDTCKTSRLAIVDNCGHGMIEPGLQQAFMAVTERWMKE
jgi:proline iminopeptidase